MGALGSGWGGGTFFENQIWLWSWKKGEFLINENDVNLSNMLNMSLNVLLPIKEETDWQDTVRKINGEKENLLVVIPYQVEITE